MLNEITRESNMPVQVIHRLHSHHIRKIIYITTALTMLLCKISLQFCCEFINNNRSNIAFIWNVAKLIKLPASILYTLHLGLNLAGYKSKSKLVHKDKPKELAEFIGELAPLISSTIGVLIQTRIIHLFAAGAVSHVGLTSTILFLFISEPISHYYTYRQYQETYKKYQDVNKGYQGKKDIDELIKYKAELAKCNKDLIISTLTLSLGLLNFILKRIEIATIPINLGNGIIYNFNWSVTVSTIYSTVFLAIQLNKLFNQPINDNPSTKLGGTINHNLPNGCAMWR
ncbi:hypothetical protein GO684_03430 [Wolbachia endosymbiont of Litomosoides brasiliensis]|uniref:hypothetical protein n=1 Tax=Wolbachia endosymbiont of Litomosoides brasiliensis TaxID=1812117 RepID=UPI00158B23F6|nr:hypothetical protein [Wolbachia endosymbiont of Litomosoides brasiliensis]NUY39701.1 hypothetical protein [Wolbachia endosymbiont of Litomosoides brasiliensis]